MSHQKNIEVDTAGADRSTIVQVGEGDTPEDVLEDAFDALDETDGNIDHFQLRQGTGEELPDGTDVYSEIESGEVLHATTAPVLG